MATSIHIKCSGKLPAFNICRHRSHVVYNTCYLLLVLCLLLTGMSQPSQADVIYATNVTAIGSDVIVIPIPQYSGVDPLANIAFVLSVNLFGTNGFENISLLDDDVNVDVDFRQSFSLQRPDTSEITAVEVSATTNVTVTLFDTILDYGGTSGMTFDSMAAAGLNSTTSPPPAGDIVLFSGSGNVNLALIFTNTSTFVANKGTLATFSSPISSVSLQITYSPIPEPTVALLLVAGSIGLWTVKRRRERSTANNVHTISTRSMFR